MDGWGCQATECRRTALEHLKRASQAQSWARDGTRHCPRSPPDSLQSTWGAHHINEFIYQPGWAQKAQLWDIEGSAIGDPDLHTLITRVT